MEEIIEQLKQIIKKLEESNIALLQDSINYSKCNITIIPDEFEIIIANHNIKLSKTEFEIMQYLVNSKNMSATHEELSQYIYGCKCDTYISRCITTHIYRLRRKTQNLLKIKTIRGRGYKVMEVEKYDR